VLIFEMVAGYPPFYSDNKVEMFKAICDVKYTFPENMSKVCRGSKPGHKQHRLTWLQAHTFPESMSQGVSSEQGWTGACVTDMTYRQAGRGQLEAKQPGPGLPHR
jgi:hypothetical protein